MKILHFIRHAKSSWADAGLADDERPLNKRGKQACQLMAPALADIDGVFHQVYCSPARRARATIKRIARQLPERHIVWHLDRGLYTFDEQALLRWCRALDDRLDKVTVVGHNPALTELCNLLCAPGADLPLDNLPTCGYLQLAFDGESWRQLAPGRLRLKHLLTPKQLVSSGVVPQ